MFNLTIPPSWERPLKIAAIVLSVLVLCFAVKTCYDRNLIKQHDAAVEVTAQKEARKADNKAANQRVKDIIKQKEKEDAYTKVIEQEEDVFPPPSTVAFNCERLRRAGKDTSSIPACGGR